MTRYSVREHHDISTDIVKAYADCAYWHRKLEPFCEALRTKLDSAEQKPDGKFDFLPRESDWLRAEAFLNSHEKLGRAIKTIETALDHSDSPERSRSTLKAFSRLFESAFQMIKTDALSKFDELPKYVTDKSVEHQGSQISVTDAVDNLKDATKEVMKLSKKSSTIGAGMA